MSDPDRQLVPSLFERTSGHPMRLALELNQEFVRKKEESISKLEPAPEPASEPEPKLEPEPAPSQLSKVAGPTQELSHSFQQAYDQLTPGQQACFRRLGALPELDSYDRFCFSTLWSSEVESHAPEVLAALESPAHLITRHTDQVGRPYWTIHPTGLKFARHLHQRDSKDERAHARRWLDRAAQTPSQKERYGDFRRRVAQNSRGWKFWQDFASHSMPSHVPRWLRLLYFFIQPMFVTEWKVAQEHGSYLSSAEMILFYQLNREEQRSLLGPFTVVWSIPVLAVLSLAALLDPRWNSWLGGLFAIWLILSFVVFIRLFFADLVRIPAWRYLWIQVSQRMNAPFTLQE